nr:PAS domain S-box protein [Methanomicrobium sp. W14]
MTKHSIDTDPEEIYFTDDSGSIYYANNAVCRSLGYTNEKMLDLSLHHGRT